MSDSLKRVYHATIKGEIIPGFIARAATPEAAKMMLQTTMEQRGYFARVRQWVESGKIVEAFDEKQD
jgi:hypothetical protein